MTFIANNDCSTICSYTEEMYTYYKLCILVCVVSYNLYVCTCVAQLYRGDSYYTLCIFMCVVSFNVYSASPTCVAQLYRGDGREPAAMNIGERRLTTYPCRVEYYNLYISCIPCRVEYYWPLICVEWNITICISCTVCTDCNIKPYTNTWLHNNEPHFKW